MTSETKKAQMRAYMLTPAGRAAHKRSQAKYIAKRRDQKITASFAANAQPLLQALANWR